MKPKEDQKIHKKKKWHKFQDINKKAKIDTRSVYNYAEIILTEPMSKLLNRGLNYCHTPPILSITELSVSISKFERKNVNSLIYKWMCWSRTVPNSIY